MITSTVLVICDHRSGEDYCEAEFEVLRDSLPTDLAAAVDRQLRLRGWTGKSQGPRVLCPLHRRPPGDAITAP